MKKLVIALVIICFAMPAMAQQVIFEEHFDSPDALLNWQDLSNTGNQYSVTAEGYLRSEWATTSSGMSFLMYTGGSIGLPDSFTITYKARLIQGASDFGSNRSDHAMVAFHVQVHPDLDSIYTSWRQNAYNDFPLWVIINNTRTAHGLIGLNAYNFDETQWHTVKVVKDGLTVSAYIIDNVGNEVQMYTETLASLSGFAGGTVALYGDVGIVEFDDLVVTVPSPPPAISGCIKIYGEGREGLEVHLNQKPNLKDTTMTDSEGCFQFQDLLEPNEKFDIKVKSPELDAP